MPMLQVTMPKLLDSFLAGQVIQTYMRVSNTGNRGLEKLSVLASHPEIFHLGKPEPFEETPQGLCFIITSCHSVD